MISTVSTDKHILKICLRWHMLPLANIRSTNICTHVHTHNIVGI